MGTVAWVGFKTDQGCTTPIEAGDRSARHIPARPALHRHPVTDVRAHQLPPSPPAIKALSAEASSPFSPCFP
jgi:hypothetical protein